MTWTGDAYNPDEDAEHERELKQHGMEPDTDKYEGHTPAPWRIEYGDMEQYGETDTVLSGIDVVALDVIRQDVALLTDAPLLLAEVKRLRKELNHAKVTIDEWDNKGGPCVTVHLEGCEYVGMLRLHKDENGKVIE